MLSNPDTAIWLYWIKAYFGKTGNERAGAVAKSVIMGNKHDIYAKSIYISLWKRAGKNCFKTSDKESPSTFSNLEVDFYAFKIKLTKWLILMRM